MGAAMPRIIVRTRVGGVMSLKSLATRLILFGFLAGAVLPLSADTLTIGFISFDNLVPDAPGSPGVNVFTVYDLTGVNSFLSPTPVSDELDFLNSTMTLNGLVPAVQVGPLAPLAGGQGAQLPPLEFPTSQAFTSAVFNAELSQLTFSVNGQEYLANSNLITASIVASLPPNLTAGLDSVEITIDASPVATPEPSSYCLTFSVLLAVAYSCKRYRA